MKNKLSLKIYGLATVGPKGQIILPKESRDDFNISIGIEYQIVMMDKKSFGIGPIEAKLVSRIKKEFKLIEKIGPIKIGTKYQFVIPSIIRKELSIEPGDNLVVMGEMNEKGIGFVKNDNIEYLFEFIKKRIKS